ncbi:MAG: class I SAM-dependent methyltransferase [Mycobacteriales bacterium]
MDAQQWDERYAAAQQWSDEPNALAASILGQLPPGRALDLAAGEGRMALWLARRGWQVSALDFSPVGLERGKARAQALGVDVDWQVADATTADLTAGHFDLVLVLYLHLPRAALLPVLTRAAAAVAEGGRLLVLGHDRDNLKRGVGGPQDEDLLYDHDLLAAAAEELAVERLEQVGRTVEDATAVDTLLVAHRPRP